MHQSLIDQASKMQSGDDYDHFPAIKKAMESPGTGRWLTVSREEVRAKIEEMRAAGIFGKPLQEEREEDDGDYEMEGTFTIEEGEFTL